MALQLGPLRSIRKRGVRARGALAHILPPAAGNLLHWDVERVADLLCGKCVCWPPDIVADWLYSDQGAGWEIERVTNWLSTSSAHMVSAEGDAAHWLSTKGL